MNLHLLLFIVAAILFAIAAFGVSSKVNLVAAGLFCIALTHIV